MRNVLRENIELFRKIYQTLFLNLVRDLFKFEIK